MDEIDRAMQHPSMKHDITPILTTCLTLIKYLALKNLLKLLKLINDLLKFKD